MLGEIGIKNEKSASNVSQIGKSAKCADNDPGAVEQRQKAEKFEEQRTASAEGIKVIVSKTFP